ncbi:hypothetical protein PWT90_06464 [Aphanocladium album]|nr:hypothetical protein PWT90_06464 [Aphanocladium album]
MKITYALAIAATFEQASATFGIGGDVYKYWTGLKPFTCPGKQPVICKPDQVPGYDWKNTPVGPIGNYGGCNFKGWNCKKKFGRRDMLAGRQDDGSKLIEADVGADGVNDNPVISAGDDIGTFDIDSFSVESEFDARFEFHYTMADGSICKQSSPVSSQGTSIVNTQCGGAKSVKLVLPENQGNQKRTFGLLKKICKVKCHKIKFWCKPPPAQTTTRTPPAQTTTKTTPPAQTTTKVTTTKETTTKETTTPPGQTTTKETTTKETTTKETTTPPGQTTTKETTSVETTTPPGQTTTKETTSTDDTTPTVHTTSTKTITSCGPEITSCPIKTPGGTHIVTVTIPVSTTICPVTETRPVVITTQPAQPTESKPTEGKPTEGKPTESQPAQTTDKGIPSETKTSPPVPTQSLPCPESVPRCLSSWLDLVKECKNNADAECFCKNGEFTKNVFSCLYSYGGTDKDVADSISFFQGICAPYAGKNPNIVTGAETITQIITVTPAKPTGAVTTITVDTTVTEPCVTSGTTIPGSSTTRVISTAMPVPQVTFTPPPAGEKEPVPTAQPGGGEKPAPGGEVAPTTVAPGSPVGTSPVTVPSGTAPPIVVNGAGKAQAGLLGAIAMVLVAAL